MTNAANTNLVDHEVQYVVDGEAVFWGRCEYIDGGWVGIRQSDGRLDEAPAHLVVPDPQ